MNEFLLVFRTDLDTMKNLEKRSPDEMQANAKAWMEWLEGIEAKNKLVNAGNRLASSGKVLKPDNVIADGPYTEIKECLVGYTVVRAGSIAEAIQLAQGCPWLMRGSVEVREMFNGIGLNTQGRDLF